jgi:uncharacterized protein YkwD
VDHDRTPVGVALFGACSSRRRLLARLITVPAAFSLGLLTKPQSVAARQDNDTNSGGSRGYSPDREERAFLDLINDYRRKNGAPNLSLQNQLGAAAEHHSQDMARKNYFSHRLSNGDSAEKNIERFGYTNWTSLGENIAAGHETAQAVMNAWKSSRGHDRNMRSTHFTEIGIGRAYNKRSRYGWYWTTTFGSR